MEEVEIRPKTPEPIPTPENEEIDIEVDHGYSKEEFEQLVEQCMAEFKTLDKWIIEGVVHKYLLGQLKNDD